MLGFNAAILAATSSHGPSGPAVWLQNIDGYVWQNVGKTIPAAVGDPIRTIVSSGTDEIIVSADADDDRATRRAGGFEFGASDALRCPSIPALNSVREFTITFDMEKTASDRFVHWEYGDRGAGDWIAVQWWGDGTLYVSVGTGGLAYGQCSLAGAARHSVVMRFDGYAGDNQNRLMVWVDDERQDLSFTGTIPSETAADGPFAMGFYAAAPGSSSGTFDDFRVYDHAFTLTELNDWFGGLSEYPFPLTGSIGGDAYRIKTPTAFDPDNMKYVLYSHGFGVDESYVDHAIHSSVTPAIQAAGYTIVSMLLGNSPPVGSAASLELLAGHKAYFRDRDDPSTWVFWGESFGSPLILMAMRDSRFNDVAGAYLTVPVCDQRTMDRDPFDAALDAAFGDFPDDAVAAGLIPVLLSGSNWTGRKFRFVRSDEDTVVPAATNADVMVGVLAGYAAERSVFEASGEHGDSSQQDPTDMTSTFDRWTA